MSLRFPDKVIITPVTYDPVTRSRTEGVPRTVRAQVEIEDKITFGSDGKPVSPMSFYMLPAVDAVQKGDMIQATEIHGVAYSGKKQEVIKVHLAGGLRPSHLEVLV